MVRMAAPTKRITIQYFAALREKSTLTKEEVSTPAATPRELYGELQARHGFDLPPAVLRVGINEEFRSWDTPLQDGDRVVFIQPVAGG